MMPGNRQKPLIAIYGSYSRGVNNISCKNRLKDIISCGNIDSRLTDFDKNIVEALPDISPAIDINSPHYSSWIYDKSNHYILTADFNAIFILKNCLNSTVWSEAEYALTNNKEGNTIIFLERTKGSSSNNTVDSLYNLERWNNMFEDIPIEYINFSDYKRAWAMIFGKLKSLPIF